MIKPNWEIFSAKFSNNKELTFEWFSYLLFCREFNLTKGWFGFKNQSGIEKNPVEDEGHVIGFQAKFYSNSLSEHKNDFLDMLDKAKRDYPELTKILIYTNQLWGQAPSRTTKKMTSPKALLDIETKASKLNIKLEWREASFFESEFVCLEHDDLSKYFFTEQALQGWQRFDDWSNTKTKIEEEYFVDDDIKIIVPHHKNDNELNVIDGINDVRKKLNIGSKSVRLVGLSGVGKTRFAQALFDERIGESNLDARTVWYCDISDSPNPLPVHFIEELKSKNKHFIVIVDNCGQDTHANLTKKIQNTEITLLTIEYDVKDDLPERTDVYKLQPNSTEIIKKVIERHHPDVNDINSRKIAEHSGGNYRLALAIASNIERTDNLALLTDSELFERLFWQKGQKNDELFKIAKNFALVYSFNIEDSGQENSELDFLANLSKVDTDTAIEAIETLKTKDIIQQRGKWRALLPHALANHLAKELISKKLVYQLDQLIKQMPARLKTSFIKRLSYLHDVPRVKELVDYWLSNDGWLGKNILNDSYDSDDLVKIRLLSSISEDNLIQLIEQKHVLDKNFLTRENPNYVEISKLIRFLAYEEHNFKKAFELLLYFTKDEQENERNNSIINLLTSLFRLYTSETLANLEQKKEILTGLKQKKEYLSILLDCISVALDFDEYGYSVRDSDENGKSSNYGYQPKTYSEICAWVDFLLQIINELDIQGIEKAREIFTNNLKEIIWTCKNIEPVKIYLEIINQRTHFSEAHSKIINILKWNTEELKINEPNLLIELENLEKILRPQKNNITQLIESYLQNSNTYSFRMATGSYEDSDLEIPNFGNYTNLINYLSCQLQDLNLLKNNISLLLSIKTGWNYENHIEELGNNISSIFNSVNDCILILNNAKIEKPLTESDFLFGITKYFKKKSIDEYGILIDYLSSDLNFKSLVCDFVFRNCVDDSDFKYLSILLKNKKIICEHPLGLAFNKKNNRISDENYELILDAIINQKKHEVIQYELYYECNIQKKVSEKYKEILLSYCEYFIDDKNIYDTKDIFNYLLQLDENTRNKIFEVAFSHFEKKDYISLRENDKNFNTLKNLIINNTSKFIYFFCENEKILKKFYFDGLFNILPYANELDVLEWIGNDQSKLSFWITNSSFMISKENSEKVWIDLLKKILDISDSPIQILDIIINNNVFQVKGIKVILGKISENMSDRLQYLSSLKTKLINSNSEILSLIYQKEQEWLKMIEIQSIKDEEEFRIKNERFDW